MNAVFHTVLNHVLIKLRTKVDLALTKQSADNNACFVYKKNNLFLLDGNELCFI